MAEVQQVICPIVQIEVLDNYSPPMISSLTLYKCVGLKKKSLKMYEALLRLNLAENFIIYDAMLSQSIVV